MTPKVHKANSIVRNPEHSSQRQESQQSMKSGLHHFSVTQEVSRLISNVHGYTMRLNYKCA